MPAPGGWSRWIVLAALVAAGCSKKSASEGSVGPSDAGSPPVQDAGTCAVASSCSARKYCGPSGDCYCTQTPEGPIACAGRPATCYMPLCNTSADCAGLGAGYICDTPNSGCCGEPPATLKRCLPPCGTDSSKDWPEGLGILVRQLHTMVDGGTTSLGGDGTNDVVTTLDAGTRTITLKESGAPIVTVVYTGAKQADVRGDLNHDGKIDYTDVETLDGTTLRRQAVWDTHLTGTMDLRDTRVIDTAARTFTDTVEIFVNGAWQVQSVRTGPAHDSQGSGCDGFAGFPSDTSGGSVEPFGIGSGSGISIVNNGTAGACSNDDALRLSRAIQRSLHEGLDCVKSLNPDLALEVQNAVASGRGLRIGCGNTCAGVNAETDVGGHWLSDFYGYRSNWNSSFMHTGNGGSPLTDDMLMQLMLHELMHWAGENHADRTGGGGTDQIYSCGRHCAKCGAYGLGGAGDAASQARDCAKCADAAHKKNCGVEKVYVETCEKNNYALCHAGLAGNFLCDKCLQVKDRACDDTELPGAALTFVCCEQCPPNAPHNDIACNGQVPGVKTPCGKPPDCP